MRALVLSLAVGAGTSVAVGLFTAEGWPGYVVGAVLAGALWLMLFFGSSLTDHTDSPWVAVDRYLMASALGVLLGGAMFALGDGNAAFWAPGFIVAGVVLPSTAVAASRRDHA